MLPLRRHPCPPHRPLWPLLALGAGVLCLVKCARRRMRERVKRMEDRQEEILRTLHEIRDQLKKNEGPR